MIRYTLKCANDHQFESWFQSADAFDKVKAANLVACPDCGDTAVTKAIMAPKVRTARGAAQTPVEEIKKPLSTPTTEQETILAKLKSEIEANSDYVGMNFAKEARAIHDGDAPARAIYGEAKLEEAKSLIEDGVPVAPLPFTPNRKTN
ncbi:DUF1178 family protein [Pseudohalocynthiibacter aestuariivivens]|jgi:hypothetical protein|uniref:DUF1178 family protein n=1 Tax=Pseudohalocynthiibacter aestuariivivens TaxID=1591409 RepID=A0ABV5JBT4_9RHOB|nr:MULTISPECIES: DUF1178 family protein [Pseudohalocynthiibacter]MBS9718667.1 DUF1178 family protein [Pseudohalocynthiibacter aestuariivivens]MCK0104143.1 DUF1178 family protein [Pseudohalocynthiibacter sp. F2068]